MYTYETEVEVVPATVREENFASGCLVHFSAMTDQKRSVIVVASCGQGDNYYEAVGSAICNENDNFDFHIGQGLAFGRALRQLGRDLIHDARYEVDKIDEAKREQLLKNEERRKASAEKAKWYKRKNKSIREEGPV